MSSRPAWQSPAYAQPSNGSAPPPPPLPAIPYPQPSSQPPVPPNSYPQPLPQSTASQNVYSSPYALPPSSQNAYGAPQYQPYQPPLGSSYNYSAPPQAVPQQQTVPYPLGPAGSAPPIPQQQTSPYPLGPTGSAPPIPQQSTSYYPSAPPQPVPQQTFPQQQTPYYPSNGAQSAPNAQADKVQRTQRPSTADVLATVSVQDGEDPKPFANAETLSRYTRMFPEAENDQGCRLFMYGPKCPTPLLLTLFHHFDFPRYSLFPYGLYNDFTMTTKPEAGWCKCQRCAKGDDCGHWALHHNLRFYVLKDTSPSTDRQPKITATSDTIAISSEDQEDSFLMADWNMLLFRFRSRRVETTEYAYDALIYQNYENSTKLRSAPLDYLLNQLDFILTNWNNLLTVSTRFLESFRYEVLQQRLETDRKIIRNLVGAAQRWEEFRRVLQNQVVSLGAIENIHLDPRWIEGRDDFWEAQAICNGYIQQFKNLDFRICTELINETDSLIQRVTNLISIDEGYRSREQNDSIRRLSWITFIFLPLVFAAGIFGMNVDLFTNDPSWLYYLYTSLIVMCLALGGYAISCSKRRSKKLALSIILAPFRLLTFLWRNFSRILPTRQEKSYSPLQDLESQELNPKDEYSTVLKWAASSGRTDVIHKLLQDSKSHETKTLASLSSGEAIMMAIKNGHTDTAKYLIESTPFDEYRDDNDMTLVHWAAKLGQAIVVEELARKGASLSDKDAEGRTPLDYALESNNEDTINLLLKGGKHISRQDTVNIQSLHFSARTGDISMIKKLHEKGSSLEARDGKGQTVIFHAVKGKQYATLKWLLEQSANIHAVDKQGFSALHIAAQECDLQSATILVDKGADVNAFSSEKLTPLLCTVQSQGVDVLKYLLDKGADIHAMDKNMDRVAHKIARRGDSAELLWKTAYDLGCNIEISGKQGNTPAHLAAESGSVAILRHLVEKNVDVRTIKNIAGYTPLMVAASAGKADAVRFLLENGCTHEIVDSSGKTLVELSIIWGNPSVMQALQDFGAKFDSVDSTSDARHPVWRAIWDGQYASVKQVLDDGLDVNYTHRGISLLQCAIEAKNLDAMRLLLDSGADAEKPDPHGWSPLHSAAFAGDVDAFLLARQRVNDQSPKDKCGWTPLDLAVFYRHENIVKILDPNGKVTEFAWSKSSSKHSMSATHHYVPPMEDSAVTGYAEASDERRWFR
ncbi:unnamed protein product [Periconia digitata]|uniref:Uncharacterized protein n=1 Tax=Periconia digitata TaxID=1303443 RepID=A0A9W4U833_9PLEO|nr:unnamed protein product [Periconia digitata]